MLQQAEGNPNPAPKILETETPKLPRDTKTWRALDPATSAPFPGF